MPHASICRSASSGPTAGRANSVSSRVFGFLSTAARTVEAMVPSPLLAAPLGHVRLPRDPPQQAAAVHVDVEAAQGVGGLGTEKHGDPPVVVGGDPAPLRDHRDALAPRLLV